MMLVLVFICLTICQVARGNGVSALAYSSLMVDKMTRMENKLADLENNLKETRVKMETMVQNVNGILDRRTGELDLIKAELATPVVAFHANTPDQTLSLNQIIDMQHVTLNEGGAYDSIHGIFTAPYSGVYFFATQICYSSANTFSYKIMVEENEVGHISQYNYNGFINCGSAHVVTAVKEKQRVWIKSYQTGQFNLNNNGTSFMGFLLQKTKGNVV